MAANPARPSAPKLSGIKTPGRCPHCNSTRLIRKGTRTNQPFAQLTVYALALTRLVPGLRLFNIKCAWFKETAYNEFYPRKLLL